MHSIPSSQKNGNFIRRTIIFTSMFVFLNGTGLGASQLFTARSTGKQSLFFLEKGKEKAPSLPQEKTNIRSNGSLNLVEGDSLSFSGNSISIYSHGKTNAPKQEIVIDNLQKYGINRLEDAIFEQSDMQDGSRQFYFITEKGVIIIFSEDGVYKRKCALPNDGSELGEKPAYFKLPSGGILAVTPTYNLIYSDWQEAFTCNPNRRTKPSGSFDSIRFETYYSQELNSPVIQMHFYQDAYPTGYYLEFTPKSEGKQTQLKHQTRELRAGRARMKQNKTEIVDS